MREQRMIGCQIKEARKAKNITPDEAAQKLGLRKNDYLKVELGQKIPSFKMLDKIAILFGTNVNNLLTPMTNNEYLSSLGAHSQQNIVDFFLDYLENYFSVMNDDEKFTKNLQFPQKDNFGITDEEFDEETPDFIIPL